MQITLLVLAPAFGRHRPIFLYPAGYTAFEEAFTAMDTAIADADRRNRQLYDSSNKKIVLRKGDLVKGFAAKYLDTILQNGSVAKEFLGGSAGSDGTPLDTDLAILKEGSDWKSFGKVIDQSNAFLTDLMFLVRDRGQLYFSEKDQDPGDRPGQYEVYYRKPALGHVGIRSGFPSTELDAIVLRNISYTHIDQTYMQQLYFTIVRNGFYIPVVDMTGAVIFTPEMFDEMSEVFAGVPYYSKDPLRVATLSEQDPLAVQVNAIESSLLTEQTAVTQIETDVRLHVTQALGRLGMTLQGPFDTSLIGGRLSNIGSSGRRTNLPGDADYDYVLVVNRKDFEKASKLKAEQKEWPFGRK